MTSQIDASHVASGIYQVKLGNSLTTSRKQSETFHTIRYTFVPESLAPAVGGGVLETTEGESILSVNSSTGDSHHFSAIEQEAKDTDCVLIFDPISNTFILEHVKSTLTCKPNRGASHSRKKTGGSLSNGTSKPTSMDTSFSSLSECMVVPSPAVSEVALDEEEFDIDMGMDDIQDPENPPQHDFIMTESQEEADTINTPSLSLQNEHSAESHVSEEPKDNSAIEEFESLPLPQTPLADQGSPAEEDEFGLEDIFDEIVDANNQETSTLHDTGPKSSSTRSSLSSNQNRTGPISLAAAAGEVDSDDESDSGSESD